jgi:hypothetical protein
MVKVCAALGCVDARLVQLGFQNIKLSVSDGYRGSWLRMARIFRQGSLTWNSGWSASMAIATGCDVSADIKAACGNEIQRFYQFGGRLLRQLEGSWRISRVGRERHKPLNWFLHHCSFWV